MGSNGTLFVEILVGFEKWTTKFIDTTPAFFSDFQAIVSMRSLNKATQIISKTSLVFH
jgi:hypothetical protein